MRLPFVLALVLLAPTVLANPYDASPRLGDAAEYVLTEEAGRKRVFLEWRAEDMLLPTGDERTLTTLRALILPEDAGVRAGRLNPWAESRLVPDEAIAVSLHWDDFPEGVVAWSASWMDATPDSRRWATRTTLGSCAPETWLLAWANDDCESGATLGGGSGNGLPGSVRGSNWTLEIAAYRRGDAPLPGPAAPIRSPATVDVVEWTAHGPAEGDLLAFPFADARNALLTQDPEAAAFFAQHPEARIMQARHAWTAVPVMSDRPWGDRIKGVPCTTSSAERAPGAEWATAWLDEGGSLFSIVQRVGSPVPADRTAYTHLDNFATRHAGGEPSTRAPAPEALAEQLELIPSDRGEVATLEYDFLPSGAVASVTRGTCLRDVTTGRVTFEGASIAFHEGEGTHSLLLQAERDRPSLPTGLSSLGTSPDAAARAPAPPTGLTPAAGATAAAAVATGLALLLGGAFLYSRIGRDEVLGHAKRARIYTYVQEKPGRTLQDLARALDLPRNTVEHHVRTLERNGYLKVHEGPKGKAIHATGQLADSYEPLLEREHVQGVLRLVRERPGLAQFEVAQILGMRKGHFSELVRQLEDAGLVVRRRVGRRQEIHPADESNDA